MLTQHRATCDDRARRALSALSFTSSSRTEVCEGVPLSLLSDICLFSSRELVTQEKSHWAWLWVVRPPSHLLANVQHWPRSLSLRTSVSPHGKGETHTNDWSTPTPLLAFQQEKTEEVHVLPFALYTSGPLHFCWPHPPPWHCHRALPAGSCARLRWTSRRCFQLNVSFILPLTLGRLLPREQGNWLVSVCGPRGVADATTALWRGTFRCLGGRAGSTACEGTVFMNLIEPFTEVSFLNTELLKHKTNFVLTSQSVLFSNFSYT